jgi:LacI family transcriptional regulator, galactose operon repressor
MATNLQIRLCADVVHSYSRGVLRGISDFAKLRGGWDVDFIPLMDPDYASALKRDEVAGVIIQARTHEQAEPLIRSGIPAVNVANVLSTPVALPSVFPEDRATGVMAADYFLREKNLRSFAFCGPTDLEYSRLRREGFCATVQPHPCVILKRPEEDSSPGRAQILKSLPRPVGIFCHNDACARAVIREVTSLGALVPDEVAVLGVDDDEINCELSGVRLSSIRLNTEQIGHEAAALLGRLIEGAPRPQQPILVYPAQVITRRSTDVIALSDPEVSAAVRFIRDRGGRDIGVEDLLERTLLARRTLEMRFRKALGRSPHQEIRRVQIERARSLLSGTDRPVGEIADACGFKETRQLSTAFHERFGLSPRQYRRRARGDGEGMKLEIRNQNDESNSKSE